MTKCSGLKIFDGKENLVSSIPMNLSIWQMGSFHTYFSPSFFFAVATSEKLHSDTMAA